MMSDFIGAIEFIDPSRNWEIMSGKKKIMEVYWTFACNHVFQAGPEMAHFTQKITTSGGACFLNHRFGGQNRVTQRKLG